jgi:phosphoribosyl-ATP pyrophosphohydrolase
MFTLDELARTIDQRAGASAEMSYTRSLLDKGPAHCARKFGEEAIELAIAAAALDRAPFGRRPRMSSTTSSSCSRRGG